MTTYTLTNGLAVFYSPNGNNVQSVDNTNVTLEIVVPDSTSSFSYTVNLPAPGDEAGDETIEIDVNDYTVRLHGITLSGATADLSEFSIFEVDWDDTSGSHTSTVLVPYIDGFVPGMGTINADYIFVIAGDALPDITSPAEWEALDDAVGGISIPTGTYGPGMDIALTNLGALVSENDLITGTSGRDLFQSGAGADEVHGLGGNDTLKGGNGADKLFGGGGKDKLFGNGGNDILKGGTGADRLFGDGGNDKLFGNGGNDILNGGNGNDRLFGGQGNDTFIFSKGADRIADFNATSNLEKIDLSGVRSIKGFFDLKKNHTAQDESDLVITAANGDTLTLKGLEIGDLDAGDFIF